MALPQVAIGGGLYQDSAAYQPNTRTLQPATTGGAILALKYDKGVICAGDTLGAYGGLHRFRDIRRVLKLNDRVLVTYTGDVADFQHIQVSRKLIFDGTFSFDFDFLLENSYLTTLEISSFPRTKLKPV